MPNDKEKLLKVMRSLDADYAHGKISEEKYRYFRSKYEDKLNTLDARDATNRIRSMQGKPSGKRKTNPKPPKLNKKKKEEPDLVQKYIINPKKGDKDFNKEKKPPMDNGTFKLIAVLVLVIGFTAGIGYGVLTFDFGNISVTDAQAIVEDTAFPEVEEVKVMIRIMILFKLEILILQITHTIVGIHLLVKVQEVMILELVVKSLVLEVVLDPEILELLKEL